MKRLVVVFLIMGLASFNVLSGELGERIYHQSCFACHNQGVFGAPRLGDSLAWAERIAKGKSTLDYNAIEGYAGSKGFMPPRGGDPSLNDQEVKSAVQYMIDKSW